MRENKGEINATIAKLQSASTDSSQAPLKGSLLESCKKRRVGWKLFRSLSKEEQKVWIEKNSMREMRLDSSPPWRHMTDTRVTRDPRVTRGPMVAREPGNPSGRRIPVSCL